MVLYMEGGAKVQVQGTPLPTDKQTRTHTYTQEWKHYLSELHWWAIKKIRIAKQTSVSEPDNVLWLIRTIRRLITNPYI